MTNFSESSSDISCFQCLERGEFRSKGHSKKSMIIWKRRRFLLAFPLQNPPLHNGENLCKCRPKIIQIML